MIEYKNGLCKINNTIILSPTDIVVAQILEDRVRKTLCVKMTDKSVYHVVYEPINETIENPELSKDFKHLFNLMSSSVSFESVGFIWSNKKMAT